MGEVHMLCQIPRALSQDKDNIVLTFTNRPGGRTASIMHYLLLGFVVAGEVLGAC